MCFPESDYEVRSPSKKSLVRVGRHLAAGREIIGDFRSVNKKLLNLEA